jgi:hypothetical protein
LATCIDERYRDGKKAIRLAKQAVASNATPWYMDTLAAAYAEAGKFADAVHTQEQVVALLRGKGGAHELLDDASKRLEFYRAGKPWRQD